MLKKFSRGIEVVGTVAFAIMILMVLFQVVMRYVFNNAQPWTEELSRYLMIWSTLIMTVVLCVENGHILLDYFVLKASPKGQKAISIILGLVMLYLIAYFLLGGIGMIQTTIGISQVSPGAGLPMWIVYIILPFTGICMLIVQLTQLVKLLFNRKSLQQEVNNIQG